MKKINLRESLLELDKQTRFKYTLTDLYEACMLGEDDKKKLVQYVADRDIKGMSNMLSNAAGVMTENVADDLTDDEVLESLPGMGLPNIPNPLSEECDDATLSLQATSKLEDIEYIMSYEMADLVVYDGDKCGEYRVGYDSGYPLDIRFDLNAPGYVYYINGEGPYETMSDETIKRDIKRELDSVLWGSYVNKKKTLGESLEKGDEITLWWKDPSWDKHAPCYARVEFIGKDRKGKYKFRSMTYGHVFLVDLTTNEITTPQGKVHKLDNSSGWMKIFNQPMNETFKSGDMVFVKPAKKLGRVVAVRGDNVEVEVQGGKDPDRKDTYYKSDLELEDSVDEGWNPNMTDCPTCGDTSFDSKKGRCSKCGYRESLQEWWPYDDDEDDSEYEYIARKYVQDGDFQTEYTWYKSPEGLNVFVFGDSDLYTPQQGNFDHEEEDDAAAQEWFDSYAGFGDDDDWLEEGVGAVAGDLAGRAVGDAWQGLKNFAKGVKDTAKDIKTSINTSDRVAKVKDGVRAMKGAKNLDDLKTDYRRRQDKRTTNRATKAAINRDTGDPQDWKYVVNGKRMGYDDFMKIPKAQRTQLAKSKKIQVFDVLGKPINYSAKLVEGALFEDGTVFYEFRDARGYTVHELDDVEVTDDAQAIMAGKSNPKVITVTKFINGSRKPDEVLWERESDRWYLSRYVGGAEYEYAEGGYYYETLTLDGSLEFATKEEAMEELKNQVTEYDEGELVFMNATEARFKFGKYIGDVEELHVERERGLHSSGKKVYESLSESQESDTWAADTISARGTWVLTTGDKDTSNPQKIRKGSERAIVVRYLKSKDCFTIGGVNPKWVVHSCRAKFKTFEDAEAFVKFHMDDSGAYKISKSRYDDTLVSIPNDYSENSGVPIYVSTYFLKMDAPSWYEKLEASLQVYEAYAENPRELMRNKRLDGAQFDEETGQWLRTDYDHCGEPIVLDDHEYARVDGRKLHEGTKLKRIACTTEFDNGRVMHGDWQEMSDEEAEERAKQKSIENPGKVYYVKYDDIMNPCSDYKWKGGQRINESVKYPNGQPVTDIDLDKALDYQYGTDRDKNNSTYSDEEKQRAVNYWMDKTDPRPDGKSYMKEAVAPDYSPKQTGKAYKVFRVKNGKLYPPMVANPGGADTPVGVWLTAEEGEFAGLSKTGRPQVKSIGSGTLSYRPGWHLGDIPRASQFDRTNKETGEKEFPRDFVWAVCDYVMDVDYQPESDEQGYMRMGKDGKPYRSDKYQHSLAGLPKLPKDGYYKYRTNPRPDTVPWVITGAIRVNKLLSDAEVNSILQSKGIEPIHRQGGDKTLAELGL